jgi:hypothetical protein
MAVMAESWNEQRLDDLNGRVDGLRTEMHAGFAQLRTEMRESEVRLRSEMHEGFAQLRTEMQAGDNQLRVEMHAGFEQLRVEMNTGFAEINRTIIQVGSGLFGTAVVATTAIVIAAVF